MMTLADPLKVTESRCLWLDTETENRITVRWTLDLDLHRFVVVADVTARHVSMPGFCISMLWVVAEGVVLAKGDCVAVAQLGVRHHQKHLLERRWAWSTRLEHRVCFAGLVDGQQRLPRFFVPVVPARPVSGGHLFPPCTSDDVTVSVWWGWRGAAPRWYRSTAGVTGCLRLKLHAATTAITVLWRRWSHHGETLSILAHLNPTSTRRRCPQRRPIRKTFTKT